MIGYTTEANGKGADKDTVRFISIIEPTTLEPGGTSSGDDYYRVVATNLYETLVREAPTDRTVLQPMLAEEWEIAPDGLSVDFTIKSGVKFHNGTEMTTEDVAYSLNRAINLATNVDLTGMMDRAEAVDDSHVVLY